MYIFLKYPDKVSYTIKSIYLLKKTYTKATLKLIFLFIY